MPIFDNLPYNEFLDLHNSVHLLVRALLLLLYVITLTACILQTGRRFYFGKWNTKLLWTVTTTLSVYFLFNIIFYALLFATNEPDAKPETRILSFLLRLSGIMTIMLALTYAFQPIWSHHCRQRFQKNHSLTTSQDEQLRNQLHVMNTLKNPKYTAVAIWYIAISLFLSILCSILYILSIFVQILQRHMESVNALDTLLLSAISIILSLPPPKTFVCGVQELIISRRATLAQTNDLQTGVVITINQGNKVVEPLKDKSNGDEKSTENKT